MTLFAVIRFRHENAPDSRRAPRDPKRENDASSKHPFRVYIDFYTFIGSMAILVEYSAHPDPVWKSGQITFSRSALSA